MIINKNLFYFLPTLVLLLFSSCDRHRYSKDDIVNKISLNKSRLNEPLIEKHAKRGKIVSKEERENIRKTVISEGILK